MCEALSRSKAKYVWLKMNPIKTGAFHVAVAVKINPNIELLDLFNCGICNDGLKAFYQGLITNTNAGHNHFGLKHLYLCINLIDGVDILCKVIRTLGSQLESLYLSVNPIGDVGFQLMIDNLLQCTACETEMSPRPHPLSGLRRLSIGSLGITDVSLGAIVKLVEITPGLVSIDLGSYKSTNFFQQKHNSFRDTVGLYHIGCLLKSNASIQKFPAHFLDYLTHFLENVVTWIL